MKGERDSVLEEMSAYKTEKEKLEKTLPEKGVAILEIMRSLVDLEGSMIHV